jgi:hypothetical protein
MFKENAGSISNDEIICPSTSNTQTHDETEE